MTTSTPARLGPQPACERRPREAALRVLRALLKSGGAGTIASLHAELGGHVNTIRLQLEHLIDDGFVTQTTAPTAGRGRPARAYEVTVHGRQVALEDPDRDSDSALVAAVAEHLAGTSDPAGAAHAVGLNWGSRLAATRGDDLVAILARQGFTPIQTADTIALQTCPLLDSARRHPNVVCGMHQGLVDAVSAQPRRLLPFATPGACLIRPA